MPVRASRPTEAELEILSVLWQHGPSTVRQVHETLQADHDTIMTTTLKTMQVMTEKGLLKRKKKGTSPYVYRPAASEERTQLQLLDNLVQRAFSGSARKMLIRAVSDSNLDDEELREIRRLIDRIRKEHRG